MDIGGGATKIEGDGLGPRQGETLKATWGESLARLYGLGFAQFLFMSLGFIGLVGVFFVMGSLPGAVTVALFALVGLYLLGVVLVFNVANAVFNTALYHYASTQRVPAGFTPEVMSRAFTANAA
jgi:uncharacterized membrane protein